jgi:substrate import-associated zinc metallohydrolase lipoprotein
MKFKTSILVIAAVVATALQVTSCSEKLEDSIFDTHEYPLDRSAYTFPLDTFVKVNFLEPYNMRFIYQMEYIGSDKEKNLTPASYENSCKLAVLTKYLWYESYKNQANEHDVFLKKYSPRIIHVIGSRNLNTSSGTETLGVTEGGTKVTLYRVNLLNPADINNLNEYFFETMHHEFGHILDNTKLHPTPFNLLSNGLYNSAGWNDTPDSVAASQGFFSNYASSSYTEDWVETLARYLTRDSITLEKMFNTAEYEWETVDLTDKDKDGTVDAKDYTTMLKGYVDIDTIGYFKEDESGKGEHKVYRRACTRDNNDNVVLGEDGLPQWKKNAIGAKQVLMSKLQFVREYMQEQYGINIDLLRAEIQEKQYRKGPDGKFLEETYFSDLTKRNEVRLLNALVYVDPATGKSTMDVLLEELEKYKEVRNK